MKKWIMAALVFVVNSTLSAQASSSTHFTCGSTGHGEAFSAQFGGSRFSDEVQLGYLEQEIKQLLRANEAGLKTSEEIIRISTSVGNCTRGSGDVLISCELDGSGWAFMDFGFTKGEQLTSEFYEVAKITRNARVAAFALKVIQKDSDAHLDLRMTISTAERENQNIVIQKKLGTLNQDWYMCQFK